MIRFAALMLASVMLAGCSSLSGIGETVSGWWSKDDNAEPPTPLQEFQSHLEVQTLWSAKPVSGGGDLHVSLQAGVGKDHLYVADIKGRISALSRNDGDEVWTVDTKTELTAGPGYGEGLVLVGSVDGKLLALNADDGVKRWEASLSSEVVAPPRAANGVVVARSGDGRLFAFDVLDGRRLWIYTRPVPVLTLRGASQALILDGAVYGGFADGKLVALDVKTGKVIWEARIAEAHGRSDLERMVDIDSNIIIANGGIHVATFQGRVATVLQKDGRPIWGRDMSVYAGLAIDRDTLYVTDAKGHVWALDRRSGNSLWKQDKLQARGVTGPAVIGEYIAVGDFEGYIHWLDRLDGSFVARTRATGKTRLAAQPVVVDGVLISLAADGSLAALRPVPPAPGTGKAGG